MFDEEVKKQLTDILSKMQDDVQIAFFSQEFECGSCKDTGLFVEEFSKLNSKISVKKYDFVKDKSKADEYGVEMIPAIVIVDNNGSDTGIKFYGAPGGYEINSFVSSILETSGEKESLGDLEQKIKSIDKDVHIKVFISLSCPYCPAAVTAAHRLALENSHIKADMIDTGVFPHTAVKYNVSGVPKIVINEKTEMVGAQAIRSIVEAIQEL